MDAIITWCKENFQLISLLVGLLGVVIAVVSVAYEIRRKRENSRHDKSGQ